MTCPVAHLPSTLTCPTLGRLHLLSLTPHPVWPFCFYLPFCYSSSATIIHSIQSSTSVVFSPHFSEMMQLAQCTDNCVSRPGIAGGSDCPSFEGKLRHSEAPWGTRGFPAFTFSHPTEGVLVGLVGDPAHHVWHAHALLVGGAWGHGVPLGEGRLAGLGEGVMNIDSAAPGGTRSGSCVLRCIATLTPTPAW